jgi:hypothetical protein
MKCISKTGIYLIIFLSSIYSLSAQLSEDAKVSVLTCGPGFEFFESFGHTALRVCDTSQGMDYVFNWGIFDFSTDNFYLKFAQGQLPYMLGITTYERFAREYARDGRSMSEQTLALTFEEKQILFDSLKNNSLPENKYYHYDFFEDNCATRVRDIVQYSLQNRKFPTEPASNTNLSFRQLFYPYADNYLWWRFGIDIALGSRSDRKASTFDYMYLPEDLMNQFDTTVLVNDSKTVVKSKQTILDELYPHSKPTGFSPNILFWILFALTVLLSFFEWKKGFYAKVFDIVLFAAIGILSLLVFYLAILSDHNATKDNLNLLWANPLFFWVLIRLRKTNNIVLYLLLGCLAVLILGFWVLPQSFNNAFYPIWLILALRLILLLLKKKQIVKLKNN